MKPILTGITLLITLPFTATAAPAADSGWGPAWARRAVWYQIFPERFRNGDPANDPTLAEIKGAWPHDVTSPWQISPWTSDWYELQPWEKANGRGIWFNIQRRRYGGDLAGILEKLDYLDSLGVNALYLNPVFASPSLHKYDGATYHHIDPTFGPDPQEDWAIIARENPVDPATWKWTAADRLMLELIREVHRRGMHLIFDGVFNHMGINSFAFQDLIARGQSSPFRDWFTVTSWEKKSRLAPFSYKGWANVAELPELREDANGIVAGPRRYIFNATRRWMDPDGDGDPSDGIDGWRLDVAFCVAHPFWKEWRQLVKQINPEAYLTAEVIDRIKVLQPYLQGDEFDAVMNYNFAFACVEFFVPDAQRIGVAEFDRRLAELRAAFPAGAAYVMQNLLDSHDTARIASLIVNRGRASYRDWAEFYEFSKGSNPRMSTRKPGALEKQTQKLLALMQMCYVGAPMIYYGDEAGMWGANDPCCRKPMVWEDLSYQPEIYLPTGDRRADPQTVAVDLDLLQSYRTLIALRRKHSVLQEGGLRTVVTDEARRVYGFERFDDHTVLTVLLNASEDEQQLLYPCVTAGWRDLLSGEKFLVNGDGVVSLTIPSLWGVVLEPVTDSGE
ncbi:MAG TPA: glycoside hydrolase family 13 protein [bacterium]|nr:glycoside hydrolase family 13 protein [bacterium]HQG45039.1 glycoside hydrolase family 13 protein [bacterium]HQI49817.1 glycoside hydrolase family 13 protein [bacterium]HQJ65116.1 glycoside hydrolase family 13 protein [bacterium]